MNNDSPQSHNIIKRALARLISIVFIAAVSLFGAAGTLRWWNGWLFIISYIILVIILSGSLFSKSPELVKERMQAGKKAKTWDRFIVPLLALVLPISALVLAGLDKRLGWSRGFSNEISLAALVLMIAASMLTFRAMKANPFFSSHVRIQMDRGQKVIRHGPYRYVRHPGYTGAILYNLAIPVLLDSWIAFGVGIAFLFVSVIRTILEDRTLHKELVGYEAYAAKVRYQLIPFIW